MCSWPAALGQADGVVEACLSASKSKGDLTLPFFEHQDVDLLHVSILDLAADKFRSSSRKETPVWQRMLLDT
jgi:hypothetical protein